MVFPGARIVWNGDAALAAVDAALARGENRAVEQLISLATPLTPYLEGDLTRAYGVHAATPETAGQGAQLQNFAPYAAFQHEGGDETRTITRHTLDPHPAAQTKFVEQPLHENRDELLGIIADEIRGALA